MAVSGNTYNGLYANHANRTTYCRTRIEAEAARDQEKAAGHVARIYRWNNGTRQNPRWEFMVHVWEKKS